MLQFQIVPPDPAALNKSLAEITAALVNLRPFFRGRLDTYVRQTLVKQFASEGSYLNGRRWARRRQSTMEIYRRNVPYRPGKIGHLSGRMEEGITGNTADTRVKFGAQEYGRGAEVRNGGVDLVQIFSKGRRITTVYRRRVRPNRQAARPITPPRGMPAWFEQGVSDRLEAYLKVKLKA